MAVQPGTLPWGPTNEEGIATMDGMCLAEGDGNAGDRDGWGLEFHALQTVHWRPKAGRLRQSQSSFGAIS